MVGGSQTADGEFHAFLWESGVGMTDLGALPGARSSRAFDINEAGQVVGYGQTAEGEIHALLWTDNLPPTADAGPDQTLTRTSPDGVTVTLDATGSSDPDGTLVTYEWSLGGISLGSGPTLEVVLPLGSHTVLLAVTDNAGAAGQDEVEIQVVNRAPTAVLQADAEVLVTKAAVFDGSASVDLDGDVVTYLWGFGDGATGAGAVATHAYAEAGTYVVTLAVTDNDGASDEATGTIGVLTPAQAVGAIREDVEELLTLGVLTEQDARGPLTTLRESESLLERGRTTPATRKLSDFIDQVNALVSSNRLGAAEGQALVGAAEDIIQVLSA